MSKSKKPNFLEVRFSGELYVTSPEAGARTDIAGLNSLLPLASSNKLMSGHEGVSIYPTGRGCFALTEVEPMDEYPEGQYVFIPLRELWNNGVLLFTRYPHFEPTDNVVVTIVNNSQRLLHLQNNQLLGHLYPVNTKLPVDDVTSTKYQVGQEATDGEA